MATRKPSERREQLKSTYAVVASTLALVIALTGAVAWGLAAHSVGTKELKGQAVTKGKLHKKAVVTKKVASNQITPAKVDLPPAKHFVVSRPVRTRAPLRATGACNPCDWQKLTDMGTYNKQSDSSSLDVNWSGVILEYGALCSYQIRVDGKALPNGGGESFAQATIFTSMNGLFTGLGTGPHSIQIWARPLEVVNPATDYCQINPQIVPLAAEISSAAIVTEIVS